MELSTLFDISLCRNDYSFMTHLIRNPEVYGLSMTLDKSSGIEIYSLFSRESVNRDSVLLLAFQNVHAS